VQCSGGKAARELLSRGPYIPRCVEADLNVVRTTTTCVFTPGGDATGAGGGAAAAAADAYVNTLRGGGGNAIGGGGSEGGGGGGGGGGGEGGGGGGSGGDGASSSADGPAACDCVTCLPGTCPTMLPYLYRARPGVGKRVDRDGCAFQTELPAALIVLPEELLAKAKEYSNEAVTGQLLRHIFNEASMLEDCGLDAMWKASRHLLDKVGRCKSYGLETRLMSA